MGEARDMMPMEKALKYGFSALEPSELLAIILRTGTQRVPVTKLTSDLMAQNEGKLKVLERRSRQELMQIPGIGPVKAFQIEAVLEIMRRYNIETLGDRFKIKSADDIFRYMQSQASNQPVENIWIILLNRQNAILERKLVSTGGTSATVFDLKTVLRHILLHPGVEALIMVHNHPSGNLRPSPQDDEITRMLKEGCNYLGLKLLDHVIVTQDSYYSYADSGRL